MYMLCIKPISTSSFTSYFLLQKNTQILESIHNERDSDISVTQQKNVSQFCARSTVGVWELMSSNVRFMFLLNFNLSLQSLTFCRTMKRPSQQTLIRVVRASINHRRPERKMKIIRITLTQF